MVTKFDVWNGTDNIPATPILFDTKDEAESFCNDFRKRYEKQGYYRDNQWNKIAPEDIILIIKTVETDE